MEQGRPVEVLTPKAVVDVIGGGYGGRHSVLAYSGRVSHFTECPLLGAKRKFMRPPVWLFRSLSFVFPTSPMVAEPSPQAVFIPRPSPPSPEHYGGPQTHHGYQNGQQVGHAAVSPAPTEGSN